MNESMEPQTSSGIRGLSSTVTMTSFEVHSPVDFDWTEPIFPWRCFLYRYYDLRYCNIGHCWWTTRNNKDFLNPLPLCFPKPLCFSKPFEPSSQSNLFLLFWLILIGWRVCSLVSHFTSSIDIHRHHHWSWCSCHCCCCCGRLLSMLVSLLLSFVVLVVVLVALFAAESVAAEGVWKITFNRTGLGVQYYIR